MDTKISHIWHDSGKVGKYKRAFDSKRNGSNSINFYFNVFGSKCVGLTRLQDKSQVVFDHNAKLVQNFKDFSWEMAND